MIGSLLRPTTTLAGPPSFTHLGWRRRLVLAVACLIAYAAAVVALRGLPSLYAPRP